MISGVSVCVKCIRCCASVCVKCFDCCSSVCVMYIVCCVEIGQSLSSGHLWSVITDTDIVIDNRMLPCML